MIIISIHALREEGDDLPGVLPDEDKKFLSTPSARRATPSHQRRQDMDKISIHALREEGDFCTMIRGTFRQYFYPRPPRGGRPVFPVRRDADRDDFYPRPPRGGRHLYEVFAPALRDEFLSTPSARRATWHGGSYWFWPGAISIHALREEGDTAQAAGGII